MIGHGADCFDSQVMGEIGETDCLTSIFAWCKSGSHINANKDHEDMVWSSGLLSLLHT